MKYANNIDALRLILASLVVISHSYGLTAERGGERDPLFRWLNHRLTLGEMAVYWFFVLSGFLISQSWERSIASRSPLVAAGGFLRKRICRIYPGFLMAVAVCF